MKKQYTAPAAKAFAFEAESMLASSLEQKDGSQEITKKDGESGAWTQRKRGWGKSSPWETDEE